MSIVQRGKRLQYIETKKVTISSLKSESIQLLTMEGKTEKLDGSHTTGTVNVIKISEIMQ